MLAVGYLSNGDLFLIKFRLLSYYFALFSCLVAFGERRGEFFIESFIEELAVVDPLWPKLH